MTLVVLATVVLAVLGTAVFVGFGALLSQWLPLSLFQASSLAIGATLALAFIIHALTTMMHFPFDDPLDNDELEWEPVDEVDTQAVLPKTHSPKVGRNAPCPCGSGKKFKHCCANSNAQYPKTRYS
jgi:hypothetical protein